MRGKGFGVELTGEILNGGNDAGRGPVDRIADDGEAAVADGVEAAPTGALGEDVKIILSGFGMRRGENEKIRLQADYFLKAHLRPVLLGVNDRSGASETHGVGDESVFAHGDEGIRPDDKEDAARGETVETLLQVGEVTFEIGADGRACFGHTEDSGKPLCRRDDIADVVRIGAVRRYAEMIESVDGLDDVQTFGDEDKIGAQSDNLFETGVDCAANFGFFLGVGRIVAIIRVTHEAILQAKRVDRFREAGGEGDDALNGQRDAHGATGFVDDLFVEGRGGGVRGRRLCAQ